MNITFIGGGSLRLLPVLRGVMQAAPECLDNSELRFYDLNCSRAADVAALVQNAPEFRTVENCRVQVPQNVRDALSGADVVYVTMGIRREPELSLARYASWEGGFLSTDQLTLSGGFLAVQLGPVVLDIARNMEKYCPRALMLIFANPVAVYSSMVNRFTKIRALGICGGFNNHRWDLSRLCGRDAFDPDWDVVACGVNHLSFIIRGRLRTEDLYSSLLPRVLNENWHNIFEDTPGLLKSAVDFQYRLYRKFGTLVFSTEIDGIGHLFPEESIEVLKKVIPPENEFDPESAAQKWHKDIADRFKTFHAAAENKETLDWEQMDQELFGAALTDISLPIFKALSGIEKMRIAAADINRGVLPGLPDEAAVEYTMDLFEDKIVPVENQYVPAPFLGVISSLSEFQTLLGEAVFRQDGKVFAAALEAYPVKQFSREKRKTLGRLFEIYRSGLNEKMLEAEKYI